MRYRLFDDMIIIKMNETENEKELLEEIWKHLSDNNFFTEKKYCRIYDKTDKFSEQSVTTLSKQVIKDIES